MACITPSIAPNSEPERKQQAVRVIPDSTHQSTKLAQFDSTSNLKETQSSWMQRVFAKGVGCATPGESAERIVTTSRAKRQHKSLKCELSLLHE
eukprot:1181934-Amphidinium_carterae.1